MSVPLFLNKLALRSSYSDSTVSFIQEDDSTGDLSLHSGSSKIKLHGDVEYEDGDVFTNLKTKMDSLNGSGGGGSSASEISDINNLQTELNSKQDTINSSSNLTVNELSAGVTKIRDFGLTTTSGDLNLGSKSGRINLLSTNIRYDLDILGNSANLKDTLDSKQPYISQGSP